MMTNKTILAVGLGGVIGAISRYSLNSFFPQTSKFPTTTLFINLIGCFLLSYLLFSPLIKNVINPWLLTGLTTGILGSFTTFSAITVELYDLANSSTLLAALYVFASVFGGLLCCYFGYKLAHRGDMR